jgi:bifunctional ADP-heptose synthase (sugar kinase/adenylyltransferase)
LTWRVLNTSFTCARKLGIPSIVGPKDSNSQKYQGAAILMPNAKELAQLTSSVRDGNVWLNDSAQALIGSLELEALVVTRGSEGMSLFQNTEGFCTG